ncbi:MAG TPA: hypothetical protein DCS67_01730 [Clostridiales bacterium UBA8960]|jgi:hypothetical protein|nr:hypothetical protein [Clostridiales bacterium UBA8960]
MSFVRSGPRILIVVSKDESIFKNFLTTHFEHMVLSDQVKTFEDIISVMNHHQTLIYMAKNSNDNIEDFEVAKCTVINDSAQEFLIKCLNSSSSQNVEFVRRAPRIIIMKVLGDVERTVSDIAEDFKASIESAKTVLRDHNEGTVIMFTKGNLNKVLEFSQFFHKAVYTTEHFSETINNLDHHVLKYINRNTANCDWYNLTITIRDRYEDYKNHYNRLIHALDCIGAGMVLKEGYSEDISRFFSTSSVYKVVLYTYMEPLEIKKVLLALEYMENGERIVDFDLYYKKKKIHWTEVRVGNIKSSEQLSEHYRSELYKSLEPDDVEYIRSIEDYIFAIR